MFRTKVQAGRWELLLCLHNYHSWIETNFMSLAFLFHYLMLNMFRMLIHPSSGACDLFVELFHGLYCSGSMRVGVTVWFGWGGVVWYPDTTPPHPTQQISRKLLRMDVLTSETCWALNNETKNKWHQVGLSLFNYQDDARSNKHKIPFISLFLVSDGRFACVRVLPFVCY